MSNVPTTLAAKPRQPGKKGVSRKLRASGWAPAIAYGPGREPVHFAVRPDDFIAMRRHYGRTHLFTIDVDGGETIKALIKDIQVDNLHRKLLHIDFWAADLTKHVSMQTRLEFTGKSIGVVKGGKFRMLRQTVMLKGPPGSIPEHFTVDITDLEIGDSIMLSNLGLPEGVIPDYDDDIPVATVVAAKVGMAGQGEMGETADTAETAEGTDTPE